MEYSKQDRLENYVERHRADFDVHEPRPELWAALEKQLQNDGTLVNEPVMHVTLGGDVAEISQQAGVPTATPLSSRRKPWAWVEHYSVAAALIVLMLAAGLGEVWKSSQVAEERGAVAVETTTATSAADPASENFYVTSGEPAITNVGQNTNARLDTAVRGMETYYVSQLADRKAELSQLAPNAVADWTRELVELDSSYQQLKRELPRHPQPEVVLTAMNRNLQIRLDILDKQLEQHGMGETAQHEQAQSEYALADSRQVTETSLHHDH